MSTPIHCPYRQSTLLQQALAPDKMRIAFLLGAGCPFSIRVADGDGTKPLIPDIRGLTSVVTEKMNQLEEHRESFQKVLNRLPENSTIEDILSHIRSLNDVVRDGNIDGLTKASLAGLDEKICLMTTDVVDAELPTSQTPYHRLATWVGGIPRTHPVEIFTPNYDLLVEQAFEAYKIPYFDGFIGSRHAFFDLASMENESLPPRWARLWKIHGSVNWWRTDNEDVVRRDTKSAAGERQMIYPSHLKYDQSRRMPYLAMLDRLRSFLARGQAVLVTTGYSFLDQHLNEVILHGLRSNPTAVCFGLLFGPRADYAAVLEKAKMHPNLSLLAKDGAILGTVNGDWRIDPQSGHPLHGIAVSGKANSCEFLLGDFKVFGEFLSRQLCRFDDEVGTANVA